jgi:nitrogen fixation protein NifB
MTVLNLPTDNPSIRLPVAPKAAARTRFAPLQPQQVRTLLPIEALEELASLQIGDNSRIELNGPGDPLSTVELTAEALCRIAARYPGARLSLATLGIDGARQLPTLKAAGLAEVLLQVNAVDPAILEKIYAWIRPGLKTLALPEAAQILIAEQRQTILAARKLGLTVTVVVTVYPEYNSHHLTRIAETVAALQADRMVLVPCRTEEGADIVLPDVDPVWLTEACRNCARHLPSEVARMPKSCAAAGSVVASTLPKPTAARPNAAVASSNGIDIDLHLGQATQILIYGPREDGLVCLRETRPAPEPGAAQRWRRLAETLSDCFAILAANAGETPRQELARAGITVIRTEDNIEGTVDVLYGGGKQGKKGRS